MAQRDKVKELVGRGLNSYHTKALQQMDRIEKKNKEQNHKISILSNELDNDYLTKTEEGSVISLEHSKEGMVYLDELQGNTLVNYCTDGSKELTLNGDIDVEGTFVTTTEGVDGGKIDVMCEGNTLVNLKHNKYDNCGVSCGGGDKSTYVRIDKNSPISLKGEILQTGQANNNTWQYFAFGKINMNLLKTNTTYTLIIKDEYKTTKGVYIQNGDTSHCFTVNSSVTSKYVGNYNYVIFKTKDDFTGLNPNYPILYGSLPSTYVGKLDISIIGVFEGDLTNQEIPKEYFEGMKSVGQDDTNGHKIEISSQNKNILKPISEKYPFFIKKGTKLVLSEKNNTPSLGGNVMLIDKNGNTQWFAIDAGVTTPRYITTNNDIYYIQNALVKSDELEYQVEIGTERTPYVPYTLNKKEISLNEPLRKLLNGVCDKFIKQGNKWYIKRNCGEIILNGSETWHASTQWISSLHFWCRIEGKGGGIGRLLCNKNNEFYGDGYYWTDNILFKNDVSNFNNIEEFRTWLQTNQPKVLYQLATPIYEEITDAELITYLDTTHISNNSIIPCNMKVKNSGYNAIIKPNTLYTVALDTNKSGTLGMNLGGAKVTTTNNVATITTPATLTDDSLRLYGKGIKSSKVRLLEGDKTNWIPSHFEGMKSSFEDKVQSDGSYKMEILSNNENLFNINEFVKGYTTKEVVGYVENGVRMKSKSWAGHERIGFKVEPHTTYKVTFTIKKENDDVVPNFEIYENSIAGGSYFWTTSVGTHTKTFTTKGNTEVFIRMDTSQLGYSEYSNVSISKISSNFIPQQSNKIQFSSIEPLRSAGNIKDKFIFKDGQLMIERNLNKVKLTRNHVRHFTSGSDGYMSANYCAILLNLNDEHPSKRGMGMELLCNQLPSTKNDIWTGTVHREGISGVSDAWDFSIKLSNTKTGLTLNDKDNTSKVLDAFKEYLDNNVLEVIYHMKEPTYEEIPFELQKIILEGYENGTLFFDTNIPPTSTVTYAGETPIVKSVKLNKTEVLNNTEDINDNIIPYLMDMDYRVVMLQLATEELEGGVSMARLFGGTYEMIKRDILSKRLTREEYGYRLADYFNAGKLTEEQVRELEELR